MASSTATGDTGDEPGRVLGAGRALVGAGRSLVEFVGFWSAVLLPFVTVALLALQPPGWLALVAGTLALDGVALLVGHCHDREC